MDKIKIVLNLPQNESALMVVPKYLLDRQLVKYLFCTVRLEKYCLLNPDYYGTK